MAGLISGAPPLRFTADGNITPFRIVKIGSQDKTVLLSASATSANLGVAGGSSRRAPGTGDDDGYTAIAGENVLVYGPGSVCQVELAGTSARGDQITADSNGRGATTTSGSDRVVGILLDSGVANDLADIMVTVYTL